MKIEERERVLLLCNKRIEELKERCMIIRKKIIVFKNVRPKKNVRQIGY